MGDEKFMFLKSHLKNFTFTSYKFYNKKDYKFDNITKDTPFLELIQLSIKRLTKVVVVIVDKNVYIEKMESILDDTFKFQLVKVDKINNRTKSQLLLLFVVQ